MNREDITRMAREAGMEQDGDNFFSPGYEEIDVHITDLERFATLVAAAAVRETSAEYRMGWNDGQINEREACAAIAEKQRYAINICLTSYPSQNGTAVGIASAIRARGNK